MQSVSPLDGAAIAAVESIFNRGLVTRDEARAMLGLGELSGNLTIGKVVVTVDADTSPLRREMERIGREFEVSMRAWNRVFRRGRL